jgi:hypothetical protein
MDSGKVGSHSESDVLERSAKMAPLIGPYKAKLFFGLGVSGCPPVSKASLSSFDDANDERTPAANG